MNDFPEKMSSTAAWLPFVIAAGFAAGMYLCIIMVALAKKAEQPRIETDEGAEKAAAMGRNIRELLSTEARKKEAEEEDEEAAIEAEEERMKVEMAIEDLHKEKPVRFSSKQLAAYTWNYSTKLGSGGFGEVYKGEFPNGPLIAVKVLNHNSSTNKRVEEQFIAEVSTIGRTYHRNLVRLYGFCHDANNKSLVYEYMQNGSLDRLLFGERHTTIKWDKLYEIALGTAKGLEYLHHHCRQRIIHYDIKPANVLLDSTFFPKLADFGLAKLYDPDITRVSLSRQAGTPGYAAPELWMPFPVTYKCDVYSFGMMLFEIIGWRRNLDLGLTESQEWFPKRVWEKFEKGELEGMMRDSGIEEKDMEKGKKMCMVALWCVQYIPETRPSMISVVKILEGETEVATPPNPFRHLASSPSPSDLLPKCLESTTNSSTDDAIMGFSTH